LRDALFGSTSPNR
jgi:hypothetical protein